MHRIRKLTLFLFLSLDLPGPLPGLVGVGSPQSRSVLFAGAAEARPRARDLGIPFEGQPGRYNAITDVPAVEVGHTTIIRGNGRMTMGQGPVRTGVTAILPRGRSSHTPSVAAVFSLNGNGELTGSHWVNESGFLESPILLTNTSSVGVVRDAVIKWGNLHFPPKELLGEAFSLPVVGETYDGFLNDINGHHVQPEHVFAALDGARSGPVAEGNVGGGTGMMTSEWKGGIGTSSRIVAMEQEGQPPKSYVVGVLVQANYGRRGDLRILGAPIGKEIPELMPSFHRPELGARDKDGSIIVVIGTNAPLLPHQMARLVRRAALGLGRLGAVSYQSSGDLFVAFGPPEPPKDKEGFEHFTVLPNDAVDPILQAAVQATEEAIVNALVAAETMTGVDGNTVHALPHDRLLEALRRHHLLSEATAKRP